MNFIPLHIYTGYTFLRSGLTMDRLFKVAKKRNYKALAITDLNSLYGLAEAEKYGNDSQIKPLYGMDLSFDGLIFTLIAKNEQGYLDLIKLSYLVSKDSLTSELLLSLANNQVMIVGTNQEKLFSIYEEGEHFLAKYLRTFSVTITDFYLGLAINSTDDLAHAELVRAFAKKYGYSLVAFPLIKYAEPDDAITTEITEAIASGRYLTPPSEKIIGPYYALNDETINTLFLEDEIALTNLIAQSTNVRVNKVRGSLLKFPLPTDETSKSYLEKLTVEGYQKRGLDLSNEQYLKRLNYELAMIDKLGYNDYFLIVQDYVKYAKSKGILVGPGRGSAAGSLVSYALDITQIDPLPNHLLFERFLNPERQTMPDIDIDFLDYRREEVVEYLRNKYGYDHLANIVTFQTIGAKQALRDVGRVFELNTDDVSRLSNTLGTSNYGLHDAYRYLPAFRKLINDDKFYLELVTYASKIEGLPRQSGLHAAGIILNNAPIKDGLPVKSDQSNHLITQYEMGYLESQGYLKMDILGLTNLTVIEEIFTSVKHNYGLDLNLDSLPYDEEAIYELIASGQTMGLFQLESAGMNQAIQEIKPNCFNDIVAVIALFRPGPMKNISTYARRKNGLEKVTYMSPDLEEILVSTYGIIVYQEQIMQICQKFAGMSLAKADLFRRAISKKNTEQLSALKEEFVEGAVKLNHSLAVATNVFDAIFEFADYGFNKSHAVGYGRLTCQMGYLKVHYPAEFYAAILGSTNTKNPKFSKYLSEIKARNVSLKAPDVNVSTNRFSVFTKALVFPLNSIKGLPQLSAQAIITERNKNGKFTSLADFVGRMYRYDFTLLQFERLIDAGALDSLSPNRATSRLNLAKLITYASIVAVDENSLQLELAKTPPPRLLDAESDLLFDLNKEYEALGIMLSGNLLSTKKDLIKKEGLEPLSALTKDYSFHHVVGMIRAVKVIKTKKGDQMAFVMAFDGDTELDLTIFPKLYEEIYPLLETNQIVKIKARRDRSRDTTYVVETLSLLEEN